MILHVENTAEQRKYDVKRNKSSTKILNENIYVVTLYSLISEKVHKMSSLSRSTYTVLSGYVHTFL